MAEAKGREFVVKIDEQDVTLCFKRPTQSQLFQIDKQKKLIYAEAARAGILTQVEAKKLAQETGAWTQRDDDDIKKLSMDIAKMEIIVKATNPDKDEESYAKYIEKIAEMRNKLMDLINRKTSILQETCEALADDQRIHKMAELCCVKPDGEKLFADKDEYQEFADNNPDAMNVIYQEAYYFEYGAPEDITADWAETKYLQRLNDKIEDSLQEAKKKEEESKNKPKRTRKKKVKTE